MNLIAFVYKKNKESMMIRKIADLPKAEGIIGQDKPD